MPLPSSQPCGLPVPRALGERFTCGTCGEQYEAVVTGGQLEFLRIDQAETVSVAGP